MGAVNPRVMVAQNRYGSLNEVDVTVITTYGGTAKPMLHVAHGRQLTAITMWDALRPTLIELASRFTVCISDCGGAFAWGNNTAVGAIGSVRSMLMSQYGCTGKIGLLAMSMGNAPSMSWAKANPTLTAFVAGMSPLLSVGDLQTYQVAGETNDGVTPGDYDVEIDTAYGGTYTDATNGPTNSPYVYRASYPASTVKTAIFYSSADKLTRPQFVSGFKTAQPNVTTYEVVDPSTGTSGTHTEAIDHAIAGRGTGSVQWPRAADWCFARLADSF